MENNRLALLGGDKVIKKKFLKPSNFDHEEKKVVNKVLDNGVLSGFLAGNNSNFLGGKEVRLFEQYWADYFGVKYAISVNSWTSGLTAMIGAIGLSPGDEVILPTWTMCATATSVVMWVSIPIFADI